MSSRSPGRRMVLETSGGSAWVLGLQSRSDSAQSAPGTGAARSLDQAEIATITEKEATKFMEFFSLFSKPQTDRRKGGHTSTRWPPKSQPKKQMHSLTWEKCGRVSVQQGGGSDSRGVPHLFCHGEGLGGSKPHARCCFHSQPKGVREQYVESQECNRCVVHCMLRTACCASTRQGRSATVCLCTQIP